MSDSWSPWWKSAVFYEIYIRSFQDSNGDGIGDLNGITSRLGYLQDLGVDAMWITPFYPSPQVDFGYDVSDHEAVDPQFGTLADFERLVEAAHARDIRIVLDIVLNHTSDQHPWFEASRSSRDSPYRDWYIWRDGRGGAEPTPPNNWESAFGGPAWTFDPLTAQWYYHHFYSAQPDLNWRNQTVEERMYATLRFWMDRGVDGFRLDAVSALFEDPQLRDNPVLAAPRVTLTGVKTQEFRWSRRLPETHELLRRLRRFVDRHSAETVLISEAYVERVDDLVHFYGDQDEMHLPFNFFLAQAPALNAASLGRAVDLVESAFGGRWPTLVLSNHDIDRACDRLTAGDAGGDIDRRAKLLAALLLTLRGSPFVYYGEEIAMRTVAPARLEDVRDPVGRRFWPKYKGRDGVRRPMAWTSDRQDAFGFSTGTPWLSVSPDAADMNVQRYLADERSVLNFYRELLRIRRSSRGLKNGNYRRITSHPDVIAFVREADVDCALVVLNCSADERPAALLEDDLPNTVALGTDRTVGTLLAMRTLRLAPYEAVILDVRRAAL